METKSVTDEALDIDLTQEVECYFLDCPSPATWAAFHKCLTPPMITVCNRHAKEISGLPIAVFVCKKHPHPAYEVYWRKL